MIELEGNRKDSTDKGDGNGVDYLFGFTKTKYNRQGFGAMQLISMPILQVLEQLSDQVQEKCK